MIIINAEMAEDDTILTSTITYQTEPPKKSLSSLYVKLFPYELLFLLFQFSERFYRLLYQQYYFQQLAKQTLAEITNYTAPTDQFCLDQDYVVNYTGDERFLEFQDTVNRLNMYTEVIFLGLSALVALVLGPLSDIIGRKPIMLISVLGLVLNGVMQFIIVHYNLNVYYYLLCAAFFGGFGGFSTTMTVMLGTIFDVTPKNWLTVRNGIIELCVALAKTTTAAASNNWIQKTGCNFEPPAWLMIAVTTLAMLLGLIMPETLSKELKLKYKAQSSKGFKKLINGVKIYTLPKQIGFDKYWQMITATSVIVLASFGLGASNQIMNYFLHNEPLEWSYDIIGIFGVLYSGSMGLTLILVLPILVWFRLSNSLICLLGALCAVSTNIVMATVKTTWEMFLGKIMEPINDINIIYFNFISWRITRYFNIMLSNNEISYSKTCWP